MEPIPFFYDAIDRNAIVVRPKEPFFDWLNSVINERKPITNNDENNIYLIHEMDSNEAVLKWIKRNFDKIFINELNDWYTDEEKWPNSRTYKMFSEWFEVEICSVILDLEDYPVTKD
jgi:hypothetical protein